MATESAIIFVTPDKGHGAKNELLPARDARRHNIKTSKQEKIFCKIPGNQNHLQRRKKGEVNLYPNIRQTVNICIFILTEFRGNSPKDN